jgi:hypothetical protein
VRLARLSVGNYRAFVDPVSLELRPLTLLFGYNSAGKSALLRLLAILGASSSPNQISPLALDAPAARGASFRDLLSRQSASPELTLGLEWRDAAATLAGEVDIRDIPERQLQLVERLKVMDGSDELEAMWSADPASLNRRVREYETTRADGQRGSLALAFQGLALAASPERSLQRFTDALRGMRDRVHWLGSLRAVPQRVPQFGVPPGQISPDGSNAGDYLAHDSLAGGELVRRASAVFERATQHRLDVKRYALAGEERYSVVVSPIGASPAIEIPIVDTGEGLAQLLPVVVLGCLAELGRLPDDSILAVEHPELHLHPVAHAPLAEFFCGLAAQARPPTMLIETHSASFLLRVQIAIAKGDLSPELVVVHWIRALGRGSVVDTIKFDAAARPTGPGWPPGVFSEDLQQSRELLAIRKRRGMA